MEIHWDQSFTSINSGAGDDNAVSPGRLKSGLLDNVPLPVMVNTLLDAPVDVEDPAPTYSISGFHFRTVSAYFPASIYHITSTTHCRSR